VIAAALLAFGVSALVVRLLMTPAAAALFLDHPNDRSMHARPVPRTGGLGIVAGVCCALGVFVPGTAALSLAALTLAAVSLVDDWRGLPVSVRLIAHFAVAAVFLLVAVPGLPSVTLVLLGLALGWMANLYNFMDGLDGLAGGMGVAGFAAYAAAAWFGADPVVAACSLAIAGGSLGFLLYNFPPARVFMGDVGSVPLGFLAAAVGVLGWDRGLWPIWFPVVVFAPFVIDASMTLVRRTLRRERVWQAHRSHYYQRLVLMGWSQRRTILFEYGLMLVGAAVGLFIIRFGTPVRPLALGALAAVYAAVLVTIDRRWRARQEA
jgi:UDP-N-acetylmuramyl pentapeptide phosphotransferase/UDP-N-acetylglucosamine-1-phosphate transferase